MKHNISKIKIHQGKDHNKMLVRKLVRSFVYNGSIKLTETRGKKIVPVLERMIYKASVENQANHNVLLRFFGSSDDVKKIKEVLSKRDNVRNSGNISIRKLISRSSDGANLINLEWTK